MGLERYVVDAVVLEGRSPREIARLHDISKSWIYQLIARFHHGGYEALTPRSQRSRQPRSAHQPRVATVPISFLGPPSAVTGPMVPALPSPREPGQTVRTSPTWHQSPHSALTQLFTTTFAIDQFSGGRTVSMISAQWEQARRRRNRRKPGRTECESDAGTC